MIKKVYWYCPRCDHATHDMPMSTRCLACGHDSMLDDYQEALKYELAIRIAEEAKKDETP
jgi:hypothetical protein